MAQQSTRAHPEPKHCDPPKSARPAAEAAPLPVNEMLDLQRTIGNQAVLRMLDRSGSQGVLQRHLQPTIVNPLGKDVGKGGVGGETKMTDAQKKYNAIRAILEKSPVGKAALKVIDDYKVVVDVAAPGPGSVFAGPAPGKILLESTVGTQEAAFILVHEANHAKASNEGKTADVTALARDVYVKTMIDEETESTVLSIQAKRGMGFFAKLSLNATPVMEERYTKAYDAAYKEAKKAKKSAAEAETTAKKAAWDSINAAFYDGSLVTSNTLETYGVYYGSFWDKVNTPPPVVI